MQGELQKLSMDLLKKEKLRQRQKAVFGHLHARECFNLGRLATEHPFLKRELQDKGHEAW